MRPQQLEQRTVMERIEAGEQLVISTISPQVRHHPRHPGQRGGALVSRCNKTVVLIIPDAPALRGRALTLCPDCERHLG